MSQEENHNVNIYYHNNFQFWMCLTLLLLLFWWNIELCFEWKRCRMQLNFCFCVRVWGNADDKERRLFLMGVQFWSISVAYFMTIIHAPNQDPDEWSGEGERFTKKLLGLLIKVQPYFTFGVQSRLLKMLVQVACYAALVWTRNCHISSVLPPTLWIIIKYYSLYGRKLDPLQRHCDKSSSVSNLYMKNAKISISMPRRIFLCVEDLNLY
jgi:hypothetical protein